MPGMEFALPLLAVFMRAEGELRAAASRLPGRAINERRLEGVDRTRSRRCSHGPTPNLHHAARRVLTADRWGSIAWAVVHPPDVNPNLKITQAIRACSIPV